MHLAAAFAGAIADKDISARPLIEHVGKILRGHHQRDLFIDVVTADQIAGAFNGEKRFRRVIDGRHKLQPEIQFGGGAKTGGDAFGHAPHIVLDHAHHRHREGARGAHDASRLGDHVIGVAAVYLGERQNRRVARADVARHDGLAGGHDLGRDDHRVDPRFRPRAMGADTGHGDVEKRAAGHHRAGANGEIADVHAWPVMHAENTVAGEFLEQTVVDHRPGTADAFLGRLENEMHAAFEITGFGEITGGAQQHGGVPVMATGVHHAGVARAMLEGVGLDDG